jgi:hypothetical protein
VQISRGGRPERGYVTDGSYLGMTFFAGILQKVLREGMPGPR